MSFQTTARPFARSSATRGGIGDVGIPGGYPTGGLGAPTWRHLRVRRKPSASMARHSACLRAEPDSETPRVPSLYGTTVPAQIDQSAGQGRTRSVPRSTGALRHAGLRLFCAELHM